MAYYRLTNMPASRLTRQSIAALAVPAGKAEIFAWDTEVPGFGVKASAGGARRYVLQYRPAGERTAKRMTVASVDALSLDDARRAARKLLAQALTGDDPHAARANAKAKAAPAPVLRVIDLADRYLADCERRLRPSTLYQTTLHLRRHWAPLHNLAADKVRRADVAAQVIALAGSSGGVSANRSRAALSAMFAWGIETGLIENNPVIGSVKGTEEQPRHRVLTEAEIRAVWRACRDDAHGRITRLLLLTAQRRDEVGSLTDDEISLDRALWVLPAARSKNKREHHIPLSVPVLTILHETPRVQGRAYLFGERNSGFSGWSRAKAALDARMVAAGSPIAPWTLHDLRRTAATTMADRLGIQPHVVEAILNHVGGHKSGVAGVYNLAAYATEKRAALDAWAAYVAELVGDA